MNRDLLKGDQRELVHAEVERAERVLADIAPAPLEAIGALVKWTMEEAVRNGANSVSMPDEVVEVAAWLSGINQAQGEQP